MKWILKRIAPESDGELGHPKLEDGTTRTVGSFLCPSLSPKKALVVHFLQYLPVGEKWWKSEQLSQGYDI